MCIPDHGLRGGLPRERFSPAAIGGHTGQEKPVSQEIYRLLSEAFASSAADGSIAAAALTANVNIPIEYSPPTPDGIRVHLESSGFSRFIYIPYAIKKRGFFSKAFAVTMYEPIAVQIGPSLFKTAADA